MKTPPNRSGTKSTTESVAHSPSQNGPVNNSKGARKITNFILFTQREFLLNLSSNIGRGGVSFAQFYLMSYLAASRVRELSMTDIARKTGHSTASATGSVDRLEKMEYVERFHALDDRRKVLVRLTTKGLEFIGKITAVLTERIAEAMKVAAAYDMDTLFANYRGDSMIAKPN